MEGIAFTCLEGTDVFASRRQPWNELLEQVDYGSDFPTYYGSPDWLEVWSRMMGGECRFYTFVAEKDGKMVGVFPLMIRKTKLAKISLPALMLASWPELDNFEVPAVDQDVRQELVNFALDHMRKNVRGWEVMLVREISIDGPTHQAMSNYFEAGNMEFQVDPKAQSPVLDLVEYNEREVKQPKKAAYRLRKFRNKMEKMGEVERIFEMATPENCMALFDECADVEQRSWKGQEDSDAAFMLTDPMRSLYQEMWKSLAATNQLAVGLIRLDGKALVAHWGPVENKRFLSYHMSFDMEHRSLGLGAVLMDDMINASPGLGLTIFDSSRGAVDGSHILSKYQCPYRKQLLLTYYRPSVRGRLMKFAREVVRPKLAKRHDD